MAHTSRSVIPLIAVPDPEELGPAMQACNLGERAFVLAKIETGESNQECARLAGYSASSPDILKSAGYQIAHRPRVQDALLEEGRKLLRTHGPRSIKTLVEIRDSNAVKPEVRLKAAVELLDRAGMNAVAQSHLTVTHELSEAQLDQRILAMAAELGLPQEAARRLLISPGDLEKNAIDADFTEVEPEVSPEEQARRFHENEQRRKVRAMSPEDLTAHKKRLRRDQSERAKARRAAHEAERLLALGRSGLEDLLPLTTTTGD